MLRYLSIFIVLTICGECLCIFILPLYVRSFKNNIESPGDWMIAVIPCAFHWWCFGRREVRRRTFRQRAGEFIEMANRGLPCHSTFLRTLNAVCQQPVQIESSLAGRGGNFWYLWGLDALLLSLQRQQNHYDSCCRCLELRPLWQQRIKGPPTLFAGWDSGIERE